MPWKSTATTHPTQRATWQAPAFPKKKTTDTQGVLFLKPSGCTNEISFYRNFQHCRPIRCRHRSKIQKIQKWCHRWVSFFFEFWTHGPSTLTFPFHDSDRSIHRSIIFSSRLSLSKRSLFLHASKCILLVNSFWFFKFKIFEFQSYVASSVFHVGFSNCAWNPLTTSFFFFSLNGTLDENDSPPPG